MKRPGHLGLLLSLAGLALTGVLSLALIWDRLPTDSANWPGAADRAGARARQQARAEQAAEAWSQVLAEGLVCGGDMAVVWARSRTPADDAAAELPKLAQALRPLAESCRQRLPSLSQVWLLPAPGQAGQAQAVLSDAPSVTLGRLSERTLTRFHEAAETEGDNYAVAPGDAAGIDQIVPVRKRAGALLLLRLRPDPGTEGMALPRVLDEQAGAQGVPIRQARGLRVAIAGDAAERQWLSSIALGLILLGAAAVGWHSREHRRHQQALQVQNEGLRIEKDFREDIEDASPVGLRVVDPQGRITAANRAFRDAAGLAREALVGREPPYSFWPPEACAERLSHLQDILAGRLNEEGYRVEFIRPDGSRWTAQVRATALHSGRGWLLTSQDITEAERRQRETDRLQAELLRHNLMAGQALQLVHDLSTPAKAIDQAALNLERSAGSGLADPMRVELAVIREQVAHQHQLIKQFIGRFMGELVYEPCDLAKIVDDAFTLQSHQAGLCNAWLINQVTKSLPQQLLARMNLLQVLWNLIGNALQWMANTPIVDRRVVVNDLRVSDPPSPEHPSGRHWLHLTVEDRGCGIPPNEWERIFEIGRTARQDGRGLGLWLCRQSIERMGGQIAVKQSSPQGTVMRIVLPFQPVPENTHAAVN